MVWYGTVGMLASKKHDGAPAKAGVGAPPKGNHSAKDNPGGMKTEIGRGSEKKKSMTERKHCKRNQ